MLDKLFEILCFQNSNSAATQKYCRDGCTLCLVQIARDFDLQIRPECGMFYTSAISSTKIQNKDSDFQISKTKIIVFCMRVKKMMMIMMS